jgi:glycosyltransferase involved in cell wall biosynthesis
MPAPLSVVLPTLNAARTLPACAAALMEGLADGVVRELVVSDGGSTDGTLTIARALGAEVVEAPAGQEVARGVAAARGDWLLILRPDLMPDPGWTVAVRAHMAAAPGQGARFRDRAEDGILGRLLSRDGRGAVLLPRALVAAGPERAMAGRLVRLPATVRRIG